VYMTDAAFSSTSKTSWLQRLTSQQLAKENVTVVLPPVCLSTGHQNRTWKEEGEQLRAAAKEAPSPVLILGPSPFLNGKGDAFETYLPAGYLFAAHVLTQADQRIVNEKLIGRSQGRFRIVGETVGPMKESLDGVIWGNSDADNYAFAVDFYLYVALTLM